MEAAVVILSILLVTAVVAVIALVVSRYRLATRNSELSLQNSKLVSENSGLNARLKALELTDEELADVVSSDTDPGGGSPFRGGPGS